MPYMLSVPGLAPRATNDMKGAVHARAATTIALITLAGKPRTGVMPPRAAGAEADFEAAYGATTHNAYGMCAMRHMHDYGTRPEQVATVKAGSRKLSSVPITGYTANVSELLNLDLQGGRFFTPTEDEHATPVAILGYNLKEQLFPDLDPIGRRVYVRGYPLRVIGLRLTHGEVLPCLKSRSL